MRVDQWFLAVMVLAGLGTLPAFADVTINEIRIDQFGTDNDEYFELVGNPGETLDGLTYFVIGDGTGGSGTIDTVIDLTGQAINPDGFFVAAEDTLTLGTADLITVLGFENSDNVTHVLVSGFTGASGDDLDLDDDGVLDLTPWTAIVDLIALVEEENPPTGTEFHYGPPSIGPDGPFVPGHVIRCPDGTGDWVIAEFDIAAGDDTPGLANQCPTCFGPDLTCSSDCATGVVSLSWVNNDVYTGIHVEITDAVGTIIFEEDLPGDATASSTTIAANDFFTASITATCAGGISLSDSCEVTGGAYSAQTHVIWAASRGGENDSPAALKAALEANGETVFQVGEIVGASCLDQLGQGEVLWMSLGTFPTDHNMSLGEGDRLVQILTAGASIFIDSADTWGFNPATAFADHDGVLGRLADGILMDEDQDDGLTTMNGLSHDQVDVTAWQGVAYSQDNLAGDDFTDMLEPTGSDPLIDVDIPGANAGRIWENNPDGVPDPTIIETAYGTGLFYKTDSPFGNVIAQSWEFGGFGGDQAALAAIYTAALVSSIVEPEFVRGDCNQDGTPNIGDPVFLLTGLFVPGGTSPGCDDACDLNDDGALNIADPVFELSFLFIPGSPPPPPPFPDCGVDPTVDTLGCATFAACP